MDIKGLVNPGLLTPCFFQRWKSRAKAGRWSPTEPWT